MSLFNVMAMLIAGAVVVGLSAPARAAPAGEAAAKVGKALAERSERTSRKSLARAADRRILLDRSGRYVFDRGKDLATDCMSKSITGRDSFCAKYHPKPTADLTAGWRAR